MLLHMVKSSLPVHLQLHLLALLKGGAHKVHCFRALPKHPQNRHIPNSAPVIRLEEDDNDNNEEEEKDQCDWF